MESLFADRKKLKIVTDDPTPARLKSLQGYLRKLLNRNKLSKEEYNTIRPQNAKPARAHGLPKIHKKFYCLPIFRPIIDTTGNTHYSVGKHLSSLLFPLTQNQYTLKDSFDTANRIRAYLLTYTTDQGYRFVSFDVESLFTNVPCHLTEHWKSLNAESTRRH